MAKGRIEIRVDYCKGCELCIPACPQDCIALSPETQTNQYGYRFLTVVNDKCIGCALCATMCPDQVIDVFRD